ncbi:TPX2 domain-containing protein [Artemisia annua]|uniref:TPX2 domain-containing protein n=1 Tax=Artemisia annua TaxID=35608 RepID=A0A2U1MCZ0_ARTAN|nr:TPX2 domain-containing protein [Artemisia annua]
MGEPTCLMHGNNVHGLGDSVSLGRFASESLAWEKWSNFPHKRYVEEAKSYAQPGSVAEKKAFFEAHYKKVAAQKAAAAAAAALLEQEKANAAASCHKSDVEERVCGTDHGAHDLLTGISNFDASKRTVLHPIKLPQPPVLNLKMFVNERKQITTQAASKAMDAAGHSSAISQVERPSENIVVAADQKNKAILNNTENLEDHPSVSEDSGTSQMDRPLLKSKLSTDQEVLQPKISRKPATPSFRSSSNGRKQHSRIPLSPANNASMHPRKENLLTPRTKNSTAMDSIDKRRAAPRSLYTLMNSGSVKESCKSNSAAARKIESTKATPSAHSTPKRCATPAKTPSKVANMVKKQPWATPSKVTSGVNKQPMATPSKSANGVNKTLETPPVKRRMETPVHPSAVGSKTPGQKWQIFSAVSKSLSAYKNKLQSPTISSPFTLRTEERAAQRKKKLEEKFNEKAAQKVQQQTTLKEKAETEFRRLRQSFCFKARPLPSFYSERETPKSPLKKTPQANLKSLTPARKPPTTISEQSSVKKSSRRLWKTSDQNPADHPLSQLARRINHENTSPNIQH